jgi:hypothetical protein
MSRRRHTPERVVRELREADRLLGGGWSCREVWEQLEVSDLSPGDRLRSTTMRVLVVEDHV